MDGSSARGGVSVGTYDAHALPSDIRWQILSGLRCVWPEDYSQDHGPRGWICREEFHPVHIVLERGGFVLAHAVVMWKFLEHAGDRHKAYGLSMVFTFPDCQARGYGIEVVRAGTHYIENTDADVAMLYCEPRLVSFYARNGWLPMETATTVIEAGGRTFSTGETLLMLFLTEKGRCARPAFEREPIHFGDTTW